MTFRRRVVMLVTAAVAVSIVAASAIVYVVTSAELRGRLDDGLRAQAGRAMSVATVVGETNVTSAAPLEETRSGSTAKQRDDTPARTRIVTAPLGAAAAGLPATRWDTTTAQPTGAVSWRVGLPDGVLGTSSTAIGQLVGPDGLRVAPAGSSALLPITADTLAVAARTARPFFATDRIAGVAVRLFTARGPDGTALTVAQPLTDVDGTLDRLLLILVLVSVGGVAVAAGLGVLVSRRALGPVRRLTEATEHVATTQDLSRRLPDGAGDELGRLAGSFNTMLGALEGARAAQRQLVADASHELRTPLTSVRTNIEALARADELEPADRERVVKSVRGQLEELSVLVGDLVDLARPAADDAEREVLRLDVLVAAAVDRARRLAPEADLRVSVEPCLVEADRARLHRAVTNLLDNAVKHGGAAGRVDVDVRDGCVHVRDHGDGIADADLPHVFERFYRAPEARGLPGSGLGLAIVQQTAEADGGTVRVERPADGDGGVRLVLALPVVAGDDALVSPPVCSATS